MVSHQEVKIIAEAAAQEAVKEVFLRLGLATTQDTDILEIQQDMGWLRKQRKGTEEVAKWIKRGIITAVVSGLLVLLWEGFKLVMGR